MKLFALNASLTFQINTVKQILTSNIILNENGNILFKNKDTTNTFNEYFGSIVETLDLHLWSERSTALPVYTSK